MATVIEATQMLMFMSQCSSKWRILAMANMLAPLTRTVTKANEMPATEAARLSYRRPR